MGFTRRANITTGCIRNPRNSRGSTNGSSFDDIPSVLKPSLEPNLPAGLLIILPARLYSHGSPLNSSYQFCQRSARGNTIYHSIDGLPSNWNLKSGDVVAVAYAQKINLDEKNDTIIKVDRYSFKITCAT